jgi:hypothetical protein
LIFFAACNLVFWLGVALGVGLTVSRTVDLGVETLLRQRQATAAALVDRAVAGARGTDIATPAASVMPTRVEALPTEIEVDAVKTTIAEVARPSATATEVPPAFPTAPALQTDPLQVGGSAAPTPTGSSPAQAASPLSQPSPSPVPLAPTPTEALVKTPLLLADQKFNTLAQLNVEMSRSSPSRPVLIRYSEAILNEELALLLAGNSELPYDNVYIDLKPNQLIVTGDVEVVGFEVSTTVVGNVVAEACRPRVQISSVSIAGVLTPGFIQEEVEKLVLEALDWYPVDYPLCMDQIVIEEERATVYGHRR